MFEISIDKSPSLEESARRFLNSLRTWIAVCVEKYDAARMIDDPDQSLFMSSWETCLHFSPDALTLDFLNRQRDRIRKYYMETEQWKHGFWAFSEGPEGIEHFNRFLGMLARLKPQDPFTRSQILDAAEHLGNWVEKVPEWFDWDRSLFRSILLGTEEIGEEEGMEVNTPNHLRLVSLSLLAYRVSNRRRYLDLAAACARPWCSAILRPDALPLGLIPGPVDGKAFPLYTLDPDQQTRYGPFLGESCEDDSHPLARAETFLTVDAVNVFLRLWRYCGEDEFLQATERLLDVLVDALHDPDSGAVADAIRSYWRTTGSSRYNAAVISAARQQPVSEVRELALEEAGHPLKVRPVGVGKAVDMLLWRENGNPRRCNPALLALAAEVTEDHELATCVLDMGFGYFRLARQVLLDGRGKTSSSRTVSAVARGGGRENHAGVVTAVLKPLLETFFPNPADLYKDSAL